MNTMKNFPKKLISAMLVVAMILALNCVTVFAADGNTTVYATKTGKCYHQIHCRTLKSCIPMTLENASRSLSPCKVCNPPVLTDTPAVGTGTGTGAGVGAAAATGFVYCSVGDLYYHKKNACGTTNPTNALNVSEKDAQAVMLTKCPTCFK